MSTKMQQQGFFRPAGRLAMWILWTLALAIVAYAEPPEVAFRAAGVYPRSDLSATEALVWRGQLSVRHKISDRFSWNLLADATPATLSRSAGIRVYSGYIQTRLTSASHLSLGRQVLWNSLYTTRFDGASAEWRKGSPGTRTRLNFYAGLVPGNEIRNDYGDSGTVVAGGLWQRSKGTSQYSLQAWTNEMAGEQRAYIGGSLRHRLGSRITQITDLAFDILQMIPEKIRLRTQLRLSTRLSAFVQYRYAGHLTFSPYPWHDDPLDPRHTLSTGVNYRLFPGLQLRLSLIERLTENQGRYLSVRMIWRGLAIYWQSQSQSTYEGQYFQLSWQRTLFEKMKIGASVGRSVYTPFDDQSPAVLDLMGVETDRTAMAATGWLQGTIGHHLSYRLFGQYAENRYFKQDGRIGFQVSYAL